jgi:Fe-S cluster biosynthesis and repair protein YggX
LWFGYKATGTPVKAGELIFFESGLDAKQFASDKIKMGESFQILPLDAAVEVIKEQAFAQGKQDDELSSVVLNLPELKSIQEQLNFYHSAILMEQSMKEQNWKEMTPDHLEKFLNDLKGMYDDSEAGKKVIANLVNEHWPDILTQQKFLLNNSTNYVMNEKNFDYLKDNLKYMGFGEKQHEALEANLKEGKESFQLTFNADVNKKPFEAVLQFRKSDTSDMYFLNSYHATLERSNGEKKDQTFYLNKGKGVTAKEAYNLLEGRPVFKELTNKQNEPYKAWIQLDFENKDKHNNHEVKQFHENYGYDLKAAVGKFAVKELDGGDNEKKLLHSLEKGNIQSVTIEKAGAEVKMFIEANPQYKTVTVYDEGLKRVQKEDLAQYQSTKQLNGKEVKQSAGQEQKEVKEDQKQGKQVGKKNKDNIENSLLPKKRNRQKKGMGLK